MSSAAGFDNPTLDARGWATKLSAYRKADVRRGVVELLITFAPFVLVWAGMAYAVQTSNYWLYGLLLAPAAGLLLRLFLIEHDCGHGSFFPDRKANDWLGRAISVLTLTPYDLWRRSHALHHASSGNLDRRGVGDIDTLTVREYLTLGSWARLRYRLYRHPVVMFGLGPFYVFFLQQRVPPNFLRAGLMPWASTMSTNLAVLIFAVLMSWSLGARVFFLVHIPIVLLAATIGVWLFYIQHQFEGAYWDSNGEWQVHHAALHGSSHYDLPPVLRWFTANIGVHHVHHLSSRIPYYRLADVLRDHPELREMGRLTLRESLGCVKLSLWDENTRRMISFREAHAALA